ncbi:unnamed protein product [Hermetia illucens]|uniref:DDE Tnp4 domain-containing protein n=1 Tax=Hermetia illucens TaxID=343691 RepID=A0A7R8Z2M6_HERIL|nr:protein ALP1-like [Hermetia illucens]CAD7093771.1 unnamed protein product [Hermetia illucens]
MPKQNLSSWMKISDEFLQKWNFPNCLGAVDGKHIQMFAPNNFGSMDFNYKKFFSNILMAVVDASYKFVMVTIGAHGSNADPSVFAASNFGKAWKQCPQQLKVPADRCLPGTQTPQPFVLVGDEAFGLSYNLLTPYSGNYLPTSERIFNYRLSRARRLVESAFRMLAHTWRILLKSLEVQPALGKLIVLCCCILHNYIKLNMKELKKNIREVQTHDPSAYVNYEARMAQPVSTAVIIRNSFAEWFINEGNLPFQYSHV